MGLLEEAEANSTDPSFYWAVGEMAKANISMSEHVQELEAAINWCRLHGASLTFTSSFVHLLIPRPFYHMVFGDDFLDAVKRAQIFIEEIVK